MSAWCNIAISIIDNVLLELGGLPYVLHLAVHLILLVALMVLLITGQYREDKNPSKCDYLTSFVRIYKSLSLIG